MLENICFINFSISRTMDTPSSFACACIQIRFLLVYSMCENEPRGHYKREKKEKRNRFLLEHVCKKKDKIVVQNLISLLIHVRVYPVI